MTACGFGQGLPQLFQVHECLPPSWIGKGLSAAILVDPKWACRLTAKVQNDLSLSSVAAACGEGALSHLHEASNSVLTLGFTIQIHSGTTNLFSHQLHESANVVSSSNCSHDFVLNLVLRKVSRWITLAHGWLTVFPRRPLVKP